MGPGHGHREGHAKTSSGGQLRAATSEDEAVVAARALQCGDCGKPIGAAAARKQAHGQHQEEGELGRFEGKH